MIRIACVPPGPVNMSKLTDEARAAWPKLLTANQLEGPTRVAFYFNDGDQPTQAAADVLVAAHDPTPAPPDPQIALDRATIVAFTNAVSGTATPAQRDETLKAVIRYLRRAGSDA